MAFRKKQKKSKKSLTSFVMKTFMILFFTVITINLFIQLNNLNQLKAQAANIVNEIEQKKEENIKLKDDKEYYNSDSYIEKIAREQLGLIKSDEMVFRNRNDNNQ